MKLKKLSNDESGVILVTILVVTVVMMILSIGIVARSMSSSASEESQVARVKLDELNKGVFWDVYMNAYVGNAVGASSSNNLDGRSFTSTISPTVGTGPAQTTTYSLTTNY